MNWFDPLIQSPWGPYLVIFLVGFLPTEIWRVLAVVLARDLREDSDLLLWVRLVASALLVAVVLKMVIAPAGVMQTVPLAGRLAGMAVGLAVLMLTRRSIIAAVASGEAVMALAVWLVYITLSSG